VARLNLPNMAYAPEEKLEVYAAAVRGLADLEPDPERQLKYLDFIDIYAALDENERIVYRQRYPEEVAEMTRFAERFLEKGREEGLERGLVQGLEQGLEQGVKRGIRQGEAQMLLRQLSLRFGHLPQSACDQVESADADTLLQWSERILTASTLDEVFR
jgi:flagellar biosynthesis/type III secretory pathway protein FliH